MHPPYLTVADLLKDESFINYCRRQNEADIRYWENYLTENPGRKALVDEALQEYRLMFTALAAADLEEQLQALRKKTVSGDAAPVVMLRSRTDSRRKIRVRVTAAVGFLLMLTAGYSLWLANNRWREEAGQSQYVSRPGERKSFQLPDGTRVTLNAESEIRIHEAFGKTTREVFLAGEAFFEVHRNPQVPFIVHTADMDITALGTAFNVRSYSGEKTETALLHGLIEVTLKKDNNRKVLLHPEEKISWQPDGEPESNTYSTTTKEAGELAAPVALVKKLHDGSVKEVAWTENKLVFDDEPFEEIVPQLARWYNATIVFASEEVRQYHFTATFRNEKLEQVLNILKTSKSFRYRYTNGKIVIGE